MKPTLISADVASSRYSAEARVCTSKPCWAVPQNQPLRDALAGKSLAELTEMLVELKRRNGSNMHNHTDVDTAQRAIRAIEIETYNIEHPTSERQLPPIDSIVVGINIDRDLRREKITGRFG